MLAQLEQESPVGDLSTPQEVAHQHIYYLNEEHYDLTKLLRHWLVIRKNNG